MLSIPYTRGAVLQTQTIKFGDLLVKLGLVSQTDLNDALQVAPQFGLPLGRTLVLSGRLTESELQLVVELQPLINQKKYPMESAKKAASLVRAGASPGEALKQVGFHDSAEKTTLGSLLREAKLITAAQLDDAQKVSYQSGMRLGRMLVLNGIISHAQLTKALNIQTMVRDRRISLSQAIQMLSAEVKKDTAVQSVALEANEMRPAPARKHVRFSEFLVLSGLATETEMLNALETSLNKQLSLGETIVQLGLVSKRVFDDALDLYNKVCAGRVALGDATDKVHKMVFGDPEHDQGVQSPVLGELLKMTGLVNDNDIKEAISLSNKYPSLIGKMLVLSGAIDEATLIASLRCQFMLKHGYLRVDDAVTALQYVKANKVSFDDALEELGLRKSQSPSGI